VKCGNDNPLQADACSACTWPLALSGWKSTTRHRRVTLDTGCVNAKGRDADLNTLERWNVAGLIELQRSEAMLDELEGEARVAKARALQPHPGLFTLDVSVLDGPDVLAGPDMPIELEEILFPTVSPLTDNQRHDIEHLRLHVRTGGDVFVTHNRNDFITRGRQEELRSHGIWVMSPSELVGLLTELCGWA
jgi:hypothetical protein